MSTINLKSKALTLRLNLKSKIKAARLAEERNLSVTQVIEHLLDKEPLAADTPAMGSENLRALVREELVRILGKP